MNILLYYHFFVIYKIAISSVSFKISHVGFFFAMPILFILDFHGVATCVLE